MPAVATIDFPPELATASYAALGFGSPALNTKMPYLLHI